MGRAAQVHKDSLRRSSGRTVREESDGHCRVQYNNLQLIVTRRLLFGSRDTLPGRVK